MRIRGRKSKNINGVDVFKGLWVSPIRKGCDRREQSCCEANIRRLWVQTMRKDVAKQISVGFGLAQYERDATEGSNPYERDATEGSNPVAKRMLPNNFPQVQVNV